MEKIGSIVKIRYLCRTKANMDITSLHIESSDMSQDQQVSVKPLQDGRKMASGILSDSDSLSDYFDIAEEFQDSEQVSGSFVRFYTDELHRDFALVDLDDGRKTRVLKRYFKRFGKQALSLQRGDRLTLIKKNYSEKGQHTCWEVIALPVRAMMELPSDIREKLVEAPLHKPHWLELDTDFRRGDVEEGRIIKWLGPKFAPHYAIVEFADGATTRVSATSFRLSGKDIQDYKLNDTLTLKKVGFIPDENITKWQVI